MPDVDKMPQSAPYRYVRGKILWNTYQWMGVIWGNLCPRVLSMGVLWEERMALVVPVVERIAAAWANKVELLL